MLSMYSDSVAAAQYYGTLLPCVRVCWYYWCGGANFDDLYTQLQREYQVVSFFCKGDSLLCHGKMSKMTLCIIIIDNLHITMGFIFIFKSTYLPNFSLRIPLQQEI